MKSLITVPLFILMCSAALAQASEVHAVPAAPSDRIENRTERCTQGNERHELEYAHWNECLATRAGDAQSAREWALRARAECREVSVERRDGQDRPEQRPDIRQERARRRELARR